MKAYLRSSLILALLSWTASEALAYQLTLFPASAVYDPDPGGLDAKIGFSSGNLLVESFENEALIPGLKSNLSGHFMEGEDTCANCWDGRYTSSPSDNEGRFTIEFSGVRVFGVGIGDNDFGGNEELTINDNKAIPLNPLPGHVSNGQGRAFYLKIQADPGDADLRSIRIAKGYTLRFDHLILQRGEDEAPARPQSPGALPNPAPPQIFPSTVYSTPATERPPARSVPERRGFSARSLASSLPSDAWAKGVPLLSSAGKRYLGDQLAAFYLDPDGAVTTAKPAWLNLYYTEGKPFRLHGQVWLGGPADSMLFPGDLPDGFALFIREWDGMQRYSLTSQGADVKRRLFHGEKQTDIINAGRFDELLLERWTPFYLEANWDRIVFSLGDQTVVLEGPLDMDGANKIALAPGTKLQDVRLEVFEGQ